MLVCLWRVCEATGGLAVKVVWHVCVGMLCGREEQNLRQGGKLRQRLGLSIRWRTFAAADNINV